MLSERRSIYESNKGDHDRTRGGGGGRTDGQYGRHKDGTEQGTVEQNLIIAGD